MGKNKRTGHAGGPGASSKYRKVNRSGVRTDVVFGMLTRYSEEHCDICRRVFYNKLQLLMHNTRHLVVPLERLPLELISCEDDNLDDSLNNIEDLIPLKDLQPKDENDLDEPLTYKDDNDEFVSLKDLCRKDRVIGDLITGCKVDLVPSIAPVNQTAAKMAPVSQSKTMAPNPSEEILSNLIAECKVNLFDDLAINVNRKVVVDNDVIQLSDDDDEIDDKASELTNKLVEPSRTQELSNKFVEPPALLNKLVEPCEVNIELLKLTEGLVVPYDTLKRRIPYRCNLCNLVFESRYTAVVHQMTHIKLKIEPDTCVNCSNRYSKNCRTGLCHLCSLNKSLASYYAVTVPCPKCRRRFINKEKLLEHLTTHTADKVSTEPGLMTSPLKKYSGNMNLKVSNEPGPKTLPIKTNSGNKNLIYFKDMLELLNNAGCEDDSVQLATEVNSLNKNTTPVEPAANNVMAAKKTKAPKYKSEKQKLKASNAKSRLKRIKKDAKNLASFAKKTYAHRKPVPKISTTAPVIKTYEHKKTVPEESTAINVPLATPCQPESDVIKTHFPEATVTVIPTHKPYVDVTKNTKMPPKIDVASAPQTDRNDLNKALVDATSDIDVLIPTKQPLLLDLNRPSSQISVPSATGTSTPETNTGPANTIASSSGNIGEPLAIVWSKNGNMTLSNAANLPIAALATKMVSGNMKLKNITKEKPKVPSKGIKSGDKRAKLLAKKFKDVNITKDSEHMQVCDTCYMFLKNTSNASYSSNKKTVYKITCEVPETGTMHACQKCGSLCRGIKVIEKITTHPLIPFMTPITKSLASRIRFEGETEERQLNDIKHCLNNVKRLKNIRSRIKELKSMISSKTK